MEPPTSGTDLSTQRAAVINQHLEKSSSLINDVKRPMEGLAASLDGLNNQTILLALLGEISTKQEIAGLREQMRNQSQKHQDGISEIQDILDNFLQKQVVENMRKQVEQEIQSHIDDFVKEHVMECLRDHIPLDLQHEVAERKDELERLNLALHNSESRRANGNLRTTRPDDVLATLLMSNGLVSEQFPKDLKALFSLDGKSNRRINSYVRTRLLIGDLSTQKS
jgi:type I site-specific restriction endonuclease